jgi:hypothetical protein
MLPFTISIDHMVLQVQSSEDIPPLRASASCTASTHTGQHKHKHKPLYLHIQPPPPPSPGEMLWLRRFFSGFSSLRSVFHFWPVYLRCVIALSVDLHHTLLFLRLINIQQELHLPSNPNYWQRNSAKITVIDVATGYKSNYLGNKIARDFSSIALLRTKFFKITSLWHFLVTRLVLNTLEHQLLFAADWFITKWKLPHTSTNSQAAPATHKTVAF